MPCDSSYLNAQPEERESAQVLEFLKEISGQPFNHEHPVEYYGRVATLDRDTSELCAWCSANVSLMSSMSLELQLWWKRHQEKDRQRAAQDAKDFARLDAFERAYAKLSPEDRIALGFRPEE